MPELPEVETIVRALGEGGRGGHSIIGQKIKQVIILWDKSIACPATSEFKKRTSGTIIRSVGRRGKYIVIELNRGWLLIHLRMSGDLRVISGNKQIEKHDRIILEFEKGDRLIFNDARKFGRIWFVNDPAEVCGMLGFEPFDLALSGTYFASLLSSRKTRIKTLLLDQTFLAGIGNIYADEALFLAGIHPLTMAAALTKPSANRLLKSIKQVLQLGIDRNGASIDWVYRGGEFQNDFYVYQRTSKPCRICGTTIERLVIGQRGSHYCPSCQKLFLKDES